jgi:energy-coupling factor transporter ATP-binding protein EcfA2
VRKLLEVLHELVDQGNTVVVIEHNLDVIKTADWIIDLGPEGGDGGGEIVAEGTPEEVARSRRNETGAMRHCPGVRDRLGKYCQRSLTVTAGCLARLSPPDLRSCQWDRPRFVAQVGRRAGAVYHTHSALV